MSAQLAWSVNFCFDFLNLTLVHNYEGFFFFLIPLAQLVYLFFPLSFFLGVREAAARLPAIFSNKFKWFCFPKYKKNC